MEDIKDAEVQYNKFVETLSLDDVIVEDKYEQEIQARFKKGDLKHYSEMYTAFSKNIEFKAILAIVLCTFNGASRKKLMKTKIKIKGSDTLLSVLFPIDKENVKEAFNENSLKKPTIKKILSIHLGSTITLRKFKQGTHQKLRETDTIAYYIRQISFPYVAHQFSLFLQIMEKEGISVSKKNINTLKTRLSYQMAISLYYATTDFGFKQDNYGNSRVSKLKINREDSEERLNYCRKALDKDSFEGILYIDNNGRDVSKDGVCFLYNEFKNLGNKDYHRTGNVYDYVKNTYYSNISTMSKDDSDIILMKKISRTSKNDDKRSSDDASIQVEFINNDH
jgi:hypothetical protein